MSRPGPGYSRGPPSSDPSTSTLFDGRGGGDSSGDFYDSLNPRASPSPYGSHEQGLNTVFEQEEPASSPEMNRDGQQWGGYQQDQYGGGGGGYYGQQGQQGQQAQQGAYGGYDSSAQGYGQQQGYDQQSYSADSSQQAVDAPYYPGWIWDAASGQYLPDETYGGEGEQSGAASTEPGQAEDDSQTQQQSQAVDAPYYPGWVWDAASGQYLPDSNYGGEGEQHGESSAADQGQAADGGAQNGYSQGGYEHQYDSYGAQYGQADVAQSYAPTAQNQQRQPDPYSTQSQPSSASYDQSEHQTRQPAGFDAQEEEDPYANGPYNAGSYTQYGQADSYGQQQQQDSHDSYGQDQHQPAQTHEQEDPYAADSNPYADESAGGDPFAQSESNDPFARQQSYDPFGTHDQQQQASNQSFDPYAAQHHAQPPQQQVQRQQEAQHEYQQQQQPKQQDAFDPYAPKTSRAAPPSTAASQPSAPAQSRAAYSPPPPQQQFTSFGAAFDASAQQNEPIQAAPYDPYSPPSQQAPPPRQQQLGEPPRQEPTQPEEPAHDPYAPRKSQGKSQGRQPREQRPYDPYNLQSSQSSQGPASPPMRHQPFPQTGSSASSAGLASPPLGRAALSPPPRSGSAASNASSRQAPAPAQAGPPPRSGAQQASQTAAPPPRKGPESVASPRSEASFNLASPPTRARQLSQQQPEQRQAPPPKQQSAAPAFDLPPPRSAPSARPPQRAAQQEVDEPPEFDNSVATAPPPAAAPKKVASTAPASAPYTPAPSAPSRDSYATPSQPVLPPSQRKPPSTAGGLMRPPVPRAPHQRGASAFGSDSPYGALPTGPLTSAYEPPQTVEQIKEEEEEEEVPPEQKEPEKPEEFVPSWMQATSNAPPPPAFSNKPRDRQVKQEQHDEPRFAPPPQRQPLSQPPTRSQQERQPQQRDLADDMNKMSLDERPSQPATQQALRPPQSRAPPPSRQQQSAPPIPREGAGPPPRVGGAPPPRGPGAARPPPPMQQQQQQQRPPQQMQQQPPRAPPQVKPSLQMPMSPERGQVPQLHFEAPSPEVRGDRRGERYDYGGGRITPIPTMSGIEETPEPREEDEDDYFGRSEAQQTDSQYGMDDSTVFTAADEDRATGPTTPSSQYGGDWRADSQDAQGYDYLGHQPAQARQQQQQQKPYDPYAPAGQRDLQPPRDVPSRDLAVTPPAQQRGPTVYASPNKRAVPPRQAPMASTMARANSYDAPPNRKMSTDSYGYDQQRENAYAPPAPQQSQRQPYNPYAGAAAQVRRPASAIDGEPEDLGLERRRAPVVSFGFGGRLIVVFPGGGRPAYGADSSNPYGSAATSQPSSPSTVHIRKLADVVPSSTDGTAFPGPIFLDGGKANAGKKRKETLSWLDQRIGELEQEVSYARGAAPPGFEGSGTDDRRRKVESRLLLVKLVKVMVENEGKLTGSPKVDDAVRAIFTGESTTANGDMAALPTADQLVAASSNKATNASTAPFITYGVSPADLDQMTEYLLRGERREAVRHALDRKMWAHAFIIASCVDTDCWKEVTVEFLRTELTPSAENPAPGAEGREALRVAYGMFAGLGAESMHQFIPPQALGPGTPALRNGAQFDNGAASAPHSPTSQERQPLPPSTLAKWQETVGMIVANRTAGDSAALTSLGDALAANGWTDAAHVCYLLSPQTSLAQGLGMPTSRIVLVGSSPLTGDAIIDLESVQLTELVEFAFSLVPTVKGHDAFVGFPHLQAFRLYHAAVLADAGNISQAHRYAEAVVNTLKLATKPSPFYHPRLVAQIKTLSERLGAAPGQKEGGSWLARKVPRPTVNSLWSTFEGGFNKFVAGDEQPTAQQLAARAAVAKQANGAAVGAFSHFSSIAPGSTSGTLSRAETSHEMNGSNLLHANMPAQHASSRPTSPLATAPSAQAHHHQSPGPPPVKRAAFKTHHARSSSLGAFAGYEYSPNVAPPWQSYTPPSLPGRNAGNADRSEGREHEQSPTSPRGPPSTRRPQFAAVEEQLQEDESGFISPMAQFTPSVSPSIAAANQQQQQSQAQQQTHRRMTTAEELADLGIANSKSKKPAFDTLDEELEAEEGGMPQEKRPKPEENSSGAATPATAGSAPKLDDKPTIKPSKSWLGGWFKREASPANAGPGPVKANLGEQTSFVYDEKLKRWVNKSSKGGEESPATVTPPPRAATASPSKALRNGPPRFMSETPPVPPMPTRAATNPPPLARSATSGDLRGDTRPPSAASNPTRPPSAAGMPPRTTGTPSEGGSTRSSAKRKPKYAVYAP